MLQFFFSFLELTDTVTVPGSLRYNNVREAHHRRRQAHLTKSAKWTHKNFLSSCTPPTHPTRNVVIQVRKLSIH